MEQVTDTLMITSPAFAEGEKIPSKYTCDGENINPPLEISNVPHGAQSLTLFVEDPDAPNRTFIHWVVFNIDPKSYISENFVPGISGNNTSGKTGYTGPCPPSGSHRYFFKIFALDSLLGLEVGAEKGAIEKAMEGHVIGFGQVMGTYEKV